MMKNRDIQVAWKYHDGTKHSDWSIRNNPHFLDWANRPQPFKIYPKIEPLPLPRDVPQTGVAALSAISEPVPSSRADSVPDLQDLARILYFSAGITKQRAHPGGEIYFRAAACTGALCCAKTRQRTGKFRKYRSSAQFLLGVETWTFSFQFCWPSIRIQLPCGAWDSRFDLLRSPFRPNPVPEVDASVASIPGGRESVPTQAAGLLSRTPDQTSAADRRGATDARIVVPTVRLEKCFDDRQTGNAYGLAPQRFQAVLALEVSPRQATATA